MVGRYLPNQLAASRAGHYSIIRSPLAPVASYHFWLFQVKLESFCSTINGRILLVLASHRQHSSAFTLLSCRMPWLTNLHFIFRRLRHLFYQCIWLARFFEDFGVSFATFYLYRQSIGTEAAVCLFLRSAVSTKPRGSGTGNPHPLVWIYPEIMVEILLRGRLTHSRHATSTPALHVSEAQTLLIETRRLLKWDAWWEIGLLESKRMRYDSCYCQ